MDRLRVRKAFKQYISQYDTSDVKVRLKISHTYRVARNAELIGGNLGVNADLTWFMGLLHDIGRFDQIAKYGVFLDNKSFDHAEYGADLLFEDGLIYKFIEGETDVLQDGWENIVETAIRLHNKLELPRGLERDTELYTKILRDADVIDIIRVNTEPPFDKRNRDLSEQIAHNCIGEVNQNIIMCILEHRCVPYEFVQNEFETLISQCCLVFGLNYHKSKEMVRDQGYLRQLLRLKFLNKNRDMIYKQLRNEIKDYIW